MEWTKNFSRVFVSQLRGFDAEYEMQMQDLEDWYLRQRSALEEQYQHFPDKQERADRYLAKLQLDLEYRQQKHDIL